MPVSRPLDRPAGRIAAAIAVAVLGIVLSEVLFAVFGSDVVAGTARAFAIVASVWLALPLVPRSWRNRLVGDGVSRGRHLWHVTIATVLALSGLFVLTRSVRADVSGTVLLLIVAAVIAVTYRPESQRNG